MRKRALAPLDLLPRQRKFAELVVKTGSHTVAAQLAGYANPEADGSRLANHPAVAQAIHDEIVRVLQTESAPLALSVLNELVRDVDGKAGARVRLDAAKVLLDRAGYLSNSQKMGSGDGRSLSELTAGELREFIDRQKQEIVKLEADLAERAVDVTPGDGAESVDVDHAIEPVKTDNAPISPDSVDKAPSFLD